MPEASPDQLILAADVGGTNLNLALIARRQGRYVALRTWDGATASVASLLEPAVAFLKESAREGLLEKPVMACISGAGPVRGGTIGLTNAPWAIDGQALEQGLGLPVHLMNDFTALSYGVLLLDTADETQALPLPHGDGGLPAADARGTVLVVGAGTGLGVGYVTRAPGRPQAYPSEGGHLDLPVLDEETFAFWQHLRAGLPGPPDAEHGVSGPGIAALFAFLVQTGRCPASPVTEQVLALPEEDRPSAIARHADHDEACGHAMELFVDLYGRVCAGLCAAFLPTGGLFLAGGIAAKNPSLFLAGGRFMKSFERNSRDHINAITRSTPVFLVRNYDLSLFGAAHAGCLAAEGPGLT